MLHQHALDLRRSDRESLVLDHFFAPVEDVVEVVLVARDHVSRPVPAVAQHRGAGLRFVPVSQHELRSAHDELSRSAGGNVISKIIDHTAFGLAERLADRLGLVELGREISDVRDRRRFGHAVSLTDKDAGERGEAARQFGRQRRGSGLDPAQAMSGGKLSGFRGLGQRIERRRDSRHSGD